MEEGRQRLFPYYTGRLEVVKDRKPYTFNIVLREEAKYTPGVLQRITEVFAEEKVSILQVKTSMYKEGIRILIFADLTGREEVADTLKERLEKSLDAVEISYAPPLFDGVAIDVWSFPLYIGEKRGVILREQFYRGFFKVGWEKLGSTYGSLLYMMGVSAGYESYKEHAKVASRVHLPRFAAEMFKLLGYGVAEWRLLTSDKAVIRIYDSFECSIFVGSRYKRPMSFFVRGLLAGWLAGYWGVEPYRVKSEETKCIVVGDEYCEHHFEKG